MSKFREETISKCEKKFVLKCLEEHKRLDRRAFDEFRDIKISFGSDWGSCYASLGKTKVLAQVSCEVQTPNSTRPNEGLLYINLELTPLAAPHFEAGRQSDTSVQLNRMLEKCIKDSRAVDLESLCIKVNEKAWALRLDVNVLNYEGNILDCASIAALSALAHFKRPDVTCNGEEVIIYTYAQRDPIPTMIHHYPVCLSYAFFNDGEVIIADPTILEEEVSEATFSVALNGYNELCGFHLGGSALISPEIILETTNKAARRAKLVIEQIKSSLKEDESIRESRNISFKQCELFVDTVSSETSADSLKKYLEQWTKVKSSKKKLKQIKEENMDTEEMYPASVEQIGQQSAVLLPPETNPNKWTSISSSSEDEGPVSEAFVESSKKGGFQVELDSDASEEEATIVLNANAEINKKKKLNKT